MKRIFFLALIVILIITGFLMFTESKEVGNEIIDDGLYGIENMEFKDPREAAELFFQREYDSIMEHSDDEIKIIEGGITNFEKVNSYSGYLDGQLDVFKLEYKIKAEDPEMFNVIEYNEDNSITHAKMSLGKPLIVFENKNNLNKFMGLIYLGEIGNESTIGIEIELIKFLEEKGLKLKETFGGNHNLVEYKLREGGTYKILLSQPIKDGKEGIWAIDRWMDNHGNIYFPYIESDLNLQEYYSAIQERVDQDEDKNLLDYEYVALDFIQNYAGINFDIDIKLDEFYTLPINKYYGYVMDIKKYEWGENNFIDFDKVEFLTEEDEERLKELEIDPNILPNGYHINNPSSYPDSFIIEKDKNTKFYIIDDSGVSLKEVKEPEFIEYAKENKDRLYEIVEEGFDLIKVSEVYLP